MPVILTGSTTTTQVIGNAQKLLVPEAMTIHVEANHGVATPAATSYNNTLSVYGEVLSGTADGVSMWCSSDGAATGRGQHEVHVGLTGRIEGVGGVALLGWDNRIENFGEIHGDEYAVMCHGVGNFFANHGAVSASSGPGFNLAGDGVLVDPTLVSNTGTISGSTGIEGSNLVLDVVNAGHIEGLWQGISYYGSNPAYHLTVTNTGTIAGGSSSIWAKTITGPSFGDVTVVNHGTLVGDVSLAEGQDTVQNFGHIKGDVWLADGDDTLENHGHIEGWVHLGEGTDRYREGGSVSVAVNGGGGDDLFVLTSSGGWVDGGDGYDEVRARVDIDQVFDVELVSLHGARAISVLDDNTATELIGNDIGNIIEARGGDDLLRGRAGDDLLLGGDDDDWLTGGLGADTLAGGSGTDTMRGGAGADVFLFEGLADFGLGAARDVILGFRRGVDLIDLSEVSDASIRWLGKSGFTGGGDAELRYRPLNAAGNALVQIDVDGDGVRDGDLLLVGLTQVSAGDFAL